MRKVKRPEHNCSERVFSGERNDTGGHMCGIPATVREGGKWWCWRHTEAGKKRQERISDQRVEDYLTESRHRVKGQLEMARRSRLFPNILKALRYTRRILHGSMCQEEADCVDACENARDVIKEAMTK